MSENREPHPPACVTKNGQRDYTPQPAPQDIVRNFGRPYEPQPEPKAS